MKCGYCSAEIPDDSKFCPACGKDPQSVIVPQLEEVQFCSNCGQKLAVGQRFCTSCGSQAGAAVGPVRHDATANTVTPDRASSNAKPPVQQPQELSTRLFWLPLVVLFLLFAILLWGNDTGAIGWIVFVIYFGLVVLYRRFFTMAGCLLNIVLWVVIAGVFLIIATALPVSDNSGIGVNGNKSIQSKSDAGAGKQDSSSKSAVQRPVPDVLKPLILKGSAPATNVRYMVLEDGDRSYAFLTYNLRGPYIDIGNGTGEQYWNVNMVFYPDAEKAKRGYRSQAEISLKDFQRDIKVYDRFVQKPANKGDEGVLFTGFITMTRFGEYSNYVIRQGATQVYVQKMEHPQKPLVPQGMDKIIAVLKTIDNKSLFTGNSGKLQQISNFTMSTGVKQDTFEPVNPTDTFTPKSPAIYCSAKLTDAPANSTVKFIFYYLEGGKMEIAPVEMKAGGTRYTMAYLTAPQKGWPLGKYEVVVLFNGKESGRVSFTVK
ncbi:MAG: zinc ribbon domain-containing protein [Carboxydocellales bacterium]